jgi:TDG/mug DNA glycosylase family protein
MQSTLPKFGPLPDSHTVPDLLAPGLKLVFCGTALGRISAQERAYYAHPGNFFWRTLHQVGLTPRQLEPKEYPQLLDHGIGLTDLCKTAFGNDAELPEHAFDVQAFRDKIEHHAPGMVAFTSKRGAQAVLADLGAEGIRYGEQEVTLHGTRLFVLPSPSGQARKFWKIGPWQQLAQAIAE